MILKKFNVFWKFKFFNSKKNTFSSENQLNLIILNKTFNVFFMPLIITVAMDATYIRFKFHLIVALFCHDLVAHRFHSRRFRVRSLARRTDNIRMEAMRLQYS